MKEFPPLHVVMTHFSRFVIPNYDTTFRYANHFVAPHRITTFSTIEWQAIAKQKCVCAGERERESHIKCEAILIVWRTTVILTLIPCLHTRIQTLLFSEQIATKKSIWYRFL